MTYDKIPSELRELIQWGIYKREWDETRKKWKKKPHNPFNGKLASSTDESTWSDFQTALDAIGRFKADGLAFYFKPPYIGIDLDDIGDDLERYLNGDVESNIVYVFMNSTKTYSEISMSGKGVHIIGKAKIPGPRRRKGNVEMYTDGRFFAITGNFFGKNNEINEIPEPQIKFLYQRYLDSGEVINGNFQHAWRDSNDLSVQEIIETATASATGQRFRMFLDGGWEKAYSSQSEADMAFANDLAFWTAGDFQKMDEIFRMSSLMRDKYDQKRGKTTYGIGLLNKAVSESTNHYTGKKKADDYFLSIPGITTDIPNEPKRYYSYDDTGNAERFLDIFGSLSKYSYVNKCWYFYNGKNWEQDNIGAVRKWIDQTIEIFKQEPVNVPKSTSEDELKKYLEAKEKHLKRSRNNAGKEAMMREIKHNVAVLPEEFDGEDMLFNAQNGYVDLASGTLNNHDITKMFTRISNAEYTDKVDCPRWELFLEQIFDGDRELIRYIQKAVGYSLTASTKEQVMFILYGNGRNGKSVFLDIVSEIMGTYAKSMQADSLMVKKGGSGGHNEDIARLDGARMVTSSEPNEGVRLDEGLIKQLTGGDSVSASFKGGHVFDYKPKYKLWLATNHKPIIRGNDDGIWRRLPLIPFTVQIPLDKVDKNLTEKLRIELPGIFNWAVEGCLMWQREGLKPPAGIQQATMEYRKEMDVIGGFIEECCTTGPGYAIGATDLFKAYDKWARDMNEHPFSQTVFGKKIADRYEKKKSDGRMRYVGIDLKKEFREFSLNVPGL
ncbi:phage/plasmid primase, P4 family [Enterococcus diestrammenae]|uniref:phage/plasmid primase, P4 family n=1 Tax=Enterococcus diestrammenae TaxID=1155073 RepID=UPI001958840C